MPQRKDINEVFTPRGRNVNEEMYISRPELEKQLVRSVKGTKHSILFGESGNGKTWLYKHTFNKNNIDYKVANAGNISRHKSISETICNTIKGNVIHSKTEYSDKTHAKANTIVVEGGAEHENKYTIKVNDPLLEALESYSKKGKRTQTRVIVLDNLEVICSDDQLMKELESIIILLDDETYGFDNLKFLLVGLPQDILTYLRNQKNIESISNRIEELDEVKGFGYQEVRSLSKKGFIDLLRITSVGTMESDAIASRVFKSTLGIAQHVHEYCKDLAHCIEDNRWHFESDLYRKADAMFLKSSLRKAYLIVEEHLNKVNTKVARRNQVIYAIGKIIGHEFCSLDIEKIVKEEFPESICKNMGIGSILTSFSLHEKRMLIRNKKTNTYSILDPAVLMCIRIILYKEDGKVLKYVFKNSK